MSIYILYFCIAVSNYSPSSSSPTSNLINLIKYCYFYLTIAVITTTTSSTSAGIYYAIGTVGGIIVFILIAVVLVLTGCIMIRRLNKSQMFL